MEVPTTVIYRTSKQRPRTTQTARDEHALVLRKRKAGEQYRATENRLQQIFGKKLTRKTLFEAANKLCEKQIVQRPPDRLCKRKKEALICWFYENMKQIDSDGAMKSSCLMVSVQEFTEERVESDGNIEDWEKPSQEPWNEFEDW
jgi:hypothetical protein